MILPDIFLFMCCQNFVYDVILLFSNIFANISDLV